MELFIWMKKRRINQRKLAEHIGISEASLSNIVNRKTSPSLLVALQIQSYSKGQVKWEEMLSESSEKKLKSYLRKNEKESKK